MKKLIIVDTDDEKYTHAKVSLAYKDEDGWWSDANYETLPLVDIPHKVDESYEEIIIGNEKANYILQGIAIGHNGCVDLIQGVCNENLNQG